MMTGTLTKEQIEIIRANRNLTLRKLTTLCNTFAENILIAAHLNNIKLESSDIGKYMSVEKLIELEKLVKDNPGVHNTYNLGKRFNITPSTIGMICVRMKLEDYLFKRNGVSKIDTVDVDIERLHKVVGTKPIKEVADMFHISVKTLLGLANKHNIEIKYAIKTAVGLTKVIDKESANFIEINGDNMTISDMSIKLNKRYETVRDYCKKSGIKPKEDKTTDEDIVKLMKKHDLEIKDGNMSMSDFCLKYGLSINKAYKSQPAECNKNNTFDVDNSFRIDEKLLNSIIGDLSLVLESSWRLINVRKAIHHRYIEYLAIKGFLEREHIITVDGERRESRNGTIFLKRGIHYKKILQDSLER